jgi:hypothetical protein
MFIGISTIARNASPHHTLLGVNIRGRAEPLTQSEPAAVRLARMLSRRLRQLNGSVDGLLLAGPRSAAQPRLQGTAAAKKRRLFRGAVRPHEDNK